ncbi:hypothetical protein ACWDA7_28035 [Streptomyces sp. NPDC001156]
MKANILQFESELSLSRAAEIFQTAVKKRPLKLKVVPFKFFTPTPADDPFAAVNGSQAPEFEVGTIFSLPGPDPAMGSVIFGAIAMEGGTKLMLTSTGNMRGRLLTNSLMKHVLAKFQEVDPSIDPDQYSAHR